MTTTSPPPIASVPELHALISERFTLALGIKRRLHVQQAFINELIRVTRQKRFQIRNDIVWNAMIDVRNQLVTDLYSLTVEMRHGMKPFDPKASFPRFNRHKRGLFIELRDHHRARLSRTYVAVPDDNEYEIELHTGAKADVFVRLFPDCLTDSPSSADIEKLCEEFRLQMVPLGDDRNKNRAHALEGDFGQAKMLSNLELETLFKYLEDRLEDLSMLSALNSFSRENMNLANCGQTAADLVDLIMFGNISHLTKLTLTRTRDELYARLHEIDEAVSLTEVNKHHFNDRQFGVAILG